MAGRPFVCAACRATQSIASKGLRSRQSTRWASSSRSRSLRLAIIGSGPAGYYVAYRIMKRLPEAYVDMYERLPTPFGLVRYGVAPDHPEVKKSSENLDDVAKWPNFNFVGNVSIGNQPSALPLSAVAPHYDAILFAYGASKDKELAIPGENLLGIYSARAFVGWYNGLPEFAHLQPDLESGDSAAVLGQGNVALDVARVLLSPVDALKHTDIADHALAALSRSRIKKVSVIGRRGPLQAPATIKEIRELMTIQGSHFVPPSEGWDQHLGIAASKLPRQMKRIMELLMKGSSASQTEARNTWDFRYLLKPGRFLGEGHLTSIEMETMQYEHPMRMAIESVLEAAHHKPEWERPLITMNGIRNVRVCATGETARLDASTAFRSIGYLSEPLDGMQELGVQFDKVRGIIPNDINGRVLAPHAGPGDLAAAHVPGMYCAGWVKRGPTGVIASTLDDAFRTADILVDDWMNGVTFNQRVNDVDKLGLDGVRPVLNSRGIRSVTWSDWERLDQEERRRGQLKDKPREKVADIDEMLKIIDN